MSNNKFKSCPPLMSDARMFTNYIPSKQYNEHIKSVNSIGSNLEYKEFLQKNAEEIINKNFQYHVANKCYNNQPNGLEPNGLEPNGLEQGSEQNSILSGIDTSDYFEI